MKQAHPWILTGPWYRWEKPGVPASGRNARPVFQKYASSDFVQAFLQEPQRSVKFNDRDYVYRVRAGGASKYSLSRKRCERTEIRKIFLDTHSRFYLVVCELHCDLPGLPDVRRDAVCEAGFVVRRRVTQGSPKARKAASEALKTMAQAQARLEGLGGLAGRPVPVPTGRSPLSRIAGALQTTRARQRAGYEAEYDLGMAKLQELATTQALQLTLQGWVPSAHSGIGAWTAVEPAPQTLTERVYPLYPLIPDPAAVGHSARGRTIWFGVLPTGSLEVDGAGRPCFDAQSLYEVSCFVRRHKAGCPRKSTPGDCPGELVWSLPTEAYQLAPHFDLDGTSQRPVTIELPDLQALEAQAADMPLGRGAGVRMVSPDRSSLDFKVDADNQPIATGGPGGGAICFLAIPLITIVATFVLRLFLPIVVFIFQLWFLLRLRFCIPPVFAMDAELAAALKAEIDAGLDVGASIEARVRAGEAVQFQNPATGHWVTFNDADQFPQEFRTFLKEHFNQVHPNLGGRLPDDVNALGRGAVDLAADVQAAGALPSADEGLEYTERVEVPNP